jgi:GNAT superfamily N-acetyltransferase
MASHARAYRIRHELKPGDLGMVVHLHGLIYGREHGLDATFEPYVAEPLAQCVRAGSGRIWIAEDETGSMRGSIAMVDVGQHVGQLRWFLLVPEARGIGLGRRLLDTALAYARDRGFLRIFLWSFADLVDARRLYERAGFRVSETRTSHVWGARRTELRMELELAAVER